MQKKQVVQEINILFCKHCENASKSKKFLMAAATTEEKKTRIRKEMMIKY